jgi:hypothetical protein
MKTTKLTRIEQDLKRKQFEAGLSKDPQKADAERRLYDAVEKVKREGISG